MEVLGRENIPAHGPIIFTGNHMNQFVDGAVMMVTNPHNVGFLVAEKSYHKRIIGDFAKAVGSIPVSRPQDAAKAGPGKSFLYFFHPLNILKIPLYPNFQVKLCLMESTVKVKELNSPP